MEPTQPAARASAQPTPEAMMTTTPASPPPETTTTAGRPRSDDGPARQSETTTVSLPV